MVAMYTMNQVSVKLKETIRTALDLNWEKFKEIGPEVMIDLDKYAVSSCEEACEIHGMQIFLPLIIAVVSGKSGPCLDWVKETETPNLNLPTDSSQDCPACGMG